MSSVVTLYRAGTSGAALEPYRVVKITGGKIVHTAAVGDDSIGVTGYVVPDAVDQPMDYAVAGIVDLQCSAQVTPGARVAGVGDGKIAVALTGHKVIGVALNEVDSAVDEIIQVLLSPGTM